METMSFLFRFMLAICLTVCIQLPVIFFVHFPYEAFRKLIDNASLKRFVQNIAGGLNVSAKNTARAIPLSAIALVMILGVISATNGYTIPNLFDSSNTPFYFFVGLMAGTVGMGMAFTFEVVDSLTDL
jgi:hypothetical protein